MLNRDNHSLKVVTTLTRTVVTGHHRKTVTVHQTVTTTLKVC